MADILGLGLSHYPGFSYADEEMAATLKNVLKSDKIPSGLRDPHNWPAQMQEEWGSDQGTTAARKHRELFVAGMRRLRRTLNAFQPDAVVIFGDDQYENFREDIVPPFAVFVMGEFESRPFLKGRYGVPLPNVWGEPIDTAFKTKGHPGVARHMVSSLLKRDFDVAYSYKFHHHQGLGHAFINTILYLDYDRSGWPYPVVPFHVNAYGGSLVRNKGGFANLFDTEDAGADPPAPSPSRLFELGREIARILKESRWRVALVGSSSWSHAFLTAKHQFIYPDVMADRARFKELAAGDFLPWRALTLEGLEGSGQHEMLNWMPLVGAMYELGQKPSMCEFLESYLMNSCKCLAIFPPGGSPPGRARGSA
jgi:hypothetical protein